MQRACRCRSSWVSCSVSEQQQLATEEKEEEDGMGVGAACCLKGATIAINLAMLKVAASA